MKADLPLDAMDAALQSQILDARERSLLWFASLQAANQPHGVSRISAAHDAQSWPGMLLPGTYNAVCALGLLGALGDWTTEQRAHLTQWLQSHRQPSGAYRIAGMVDTDVFKRPSLPETWNYIDFHVTNYTLGALEYIANYQANTGAIALNYLDLTVLKAWLAERDLRDPWLEGNNIVNLGSFMLLLAAEQPQHKAKVDAALQVMFDWHDRLQEPSTGFWGVGQLSDPLRLLHAMAGSMHNFHLWYATGRPLPFQDKAVDYALTQPTRVHSACIDVDLVDLLVHAHAQINHRRAETEAWLRALLPELLAFQNADGGFADVRDGPGVAPRQQDGWVGGYAEPQGLSNTFATWFRWIAIAMIADCLWPPWLPFDGGWQFRRMIGIGYKAPRPAGHV